MRRTQWMVAVVLALSGVAYGDEPLTAVTLAPGGVTADAPFVTVDPIVDGADSFPGEWSSALIVSDGFVDPTTGITPAGKLYYENRTDWTATSATGVCGNTAMYPGNTFFIAHDIFGASTGLFKEFRSNDKGDWNYVKVTAPDGTVVECWNFGGFTNIVTPSHCPFTDADELDDGLWLADAGGLAASSLIPEVAGPPSDLIDDRGFIVRKNGDPTTDKHWFPGFPEPGDAAWSWDTYYGCFARAGFNRTFQDNGTDPDITHAVDHEVYEWAFHKAANAIPEPLQCTQWRLVWIDPPKRWIVFIAPNWFIHWGFPPIPVAPWAFLVTLGLVFGVGGFSVFRRKRTRIPVSLVLLVLAVPWLGGCGGGHKNNKFPPPINLPIPILREGWVGLNYTDQIAATGQFPPLTFTHTSAMPTGLNLDPNTGVISGTPSVASFFDVFIEVGDARGNTLSTSSSIHIGDWSATPIQIQLVSMNLAGTSTHVPVQVGMVGIGVLKIRGGDPTLPTTFALRGPQPNMGSFFISSGGVVRYTPQMGQPPGVVQISIQATVGTGGGALDSFFDVFFDVF